MGLFALAFPRLGNADYATDRQRRAVALKGVVYLLAVEAHDGKITPVASGSGTIISEDGAILTNFHVVFDKSAGHPFGGIVVGLLDGYDEDPVPTCVAFPEHGMLVRKLDLALIKCEVDLQGRPYTPSAWPAVPLGDSSGLIPGDEIWLLGYPGAGGSTITVSAGRVAGFEGEDGGEGRDWIKTDAFITHGNSGGAAIDRQSRLVGVPSAFRLSEEAQGKNAAKVGLVRPLELAKSLIARAERGFDPGKRNRAGADLVAKTPPEKVQAPEKGVWITGRVVDADSGQAIANAVVLILKPGVKVASLSETTADKVLTKGVTGANGEFTTEAPIPRGKTFSVVVGAEGYALLAEDDVLSTAGEIPARFSPWEHIRLARK
ncbi:MAG TPA: trypsin-like peptidase domain-containing protein [Kofleriaceae bacterium]|nr:trypsin-like peptidase domain-containing protein [Kofleriaceae bacterium]